jgi:serine protease AprX
MVVPARQDPRRRRWWRPVLAAATGGVVALTGSAMPAAAHERTAVGPLSAAGSYIVRARPGHLADVVALLQGRQLEVHRRIGIIEAVVATLPSGAAEALRAAPEVASVTADAAVSLLASTYDPVADANSLYNSETTTKVRNMWQKGITGKGIDVALIDSGVAPVAGLSDTGKIVNGPDLTPESQNASTRNLDTYGHGTHMAGIIAGHDAGVVTSSASNDTTSFLGVAPDARIVSVKVADAHGNSDVSQVIAGIDWVVQHAKDPGMNVRVLNLSFGTNSTQAYTLDPLAYAAEVAWRSGIVVVVSAGNSGSGGMTNPATDPFLIAVGATDTKGTNALSDDVIPSFSSQGLGARLPDIVAPGVHVPSLRVPGSYIDTQYASTGAVNTRLFRGSGTSQAAAFVSGAVAQLLQANPTYTPDKIKQALRATALKLGMANPQAQGQGLVNVAPAASIPTSTVAQAFTRSTGTGTLEASRGEVHLVLDGVTLTGEKDINGMAFNAAAMATAEANKTSWNGGVWNGSAWAGSAWSGTSWTTTSWTGRSWAGSLWSGRSWTAGTWTSAGWTSTNWAGSTWTGSTWAGRSWTGRSWADNAWS